VSEGGRLAMEISSKVMMFVTHLDSLVGCSLGTALSLYL